MIKADTEKTFAQGIGIIAAIGSIFSALSIGADIRIELYFCWALSCAGLYCACCEFQAIAQHHINLCYEKDKEIRMLKL